MQPSLQTGIGEMLVADGLIDPRAAADIVLINGGLQSCWCECTGASCSPVDRRLAGPGNPPGLASAS